MLPVSWLGFCSRCFLPAQSETEISASESWQFIGCVILKVAHYPHSWSHAPGQFISPLPINRSFQTDRLNGLPIPLWTTVLFFLFYIYCYSTIDTSVDFTLIMSTEVCSFYLTTLDNYLLYVPWQILSSIRYLHQSSWFHTYHVDWDSVFY